LEIKLSVFESFFGKTIEKLREEGEIFQKISQIYLFHHLPESEIYNIVRDINIETFNNKQVIIKEDTIGEKMYIIKSGEVIFSKSDHFLRSLSTGAFFGEGALLTKEKRSATAIAGSTVVCYTFEAEDFSKYIVNNYRLRNYLQGLMKRKQNIIKLGDLESICLIGKGNLGSYYLVRNKITKEEYTIKFISKKLIDNEHHHSNLVNEKNILSYIDHPFLIKLQGTMKDDNFVYFLMEYVKGMDMIDIIHQKKLKMENVKFLIASLLVTVDYLHNKSIIHRDIKPENIIVSTDVNNII